MYYITGGRLFLELPVNYLQQYSNWFIESKVSLLHLKGKALCLNLLQYGLIIFYEFTDSLKVSSKVRDNTF